jgi:hypothetical protein
MYNETKIALKKAFEISRILFFMGQKRYKMLLDATSSIKPPVKKEIDDIVSMGKTYEEAMEIILKEKYSSVAVSMGFSKEQGIAMLQYAAMLEEISE